MTHLAISEACISVGFSEPDMLAIVKMYAERNEVLHSSLMFLIKGGKYHQLVTRLSNDLSDVLRAVPLQTRQRLMSS